MAKQVSKTVVGSFVISSIALLILGVLIFSSGKFFTHTEKAVLFFKSSVKGLSIGAPVVFRGVEIGTVAKVSLRADYETMEAEIPVVIEMQPDRVELIRGDRVDVEQNLKKMIDHGLRAVLTMESVVTGQLMIELDFHPDVPAIFVGKDLEYPEIPTIFSKFQQIGKTVQDLNIAEIVEKISAILSGIEKIIGALDLKETIQSLNAGLKDIQSLTRNVDGQVKTITPAFVNTLDEYKELARRLNTQIAPTATDARTAIKDIGKLARNLDEQVKPMAVDLKAVIKAAESALEQGEKTLIAVRGSVSEDSPTIVGLDNALKEFSAMSRSVRLLAEYLERHPEALLRGKGGTGGK